jgi:hypothetical protein
MKVLIFNKNNKFFNDIKKPKKEKKKFYNHNHLYNHNHFK